MPKIQKFKLSFPTSVNNWLKPLAIPGTGKARMILTKSARSWKIQAIAELHAQGFMSFGKARLWCEVIAIMPDRRKRDVHNLLKVLFDAAESAGLFDDDEQLDDTRIIRGPVENPGYIDFYLGELNNQDEVNPHA